MDFDFPTRFQDQLEKAGEALENDGYNVEGYRSKLPVRNRKTSRYTGSGNSPTEAFENLMNEIQGEKLEIPIQGEELEASLRSGEPPISVIYDRVRGSIDIEEPETDTDTDYPAFETMIRYRPEFPDDYFQIGTTDTRGSYTHENAEQRVTNIKQTLEEAGLTAGVYLID